MTVLRYYESIHLPVEFDPKPLEDVYSGKPLEPILRDFKSFLTVWFGRFGSKIRNEVNVNNAAARDMSFRFKAGPMGPSIMTSHLDALALKYNSEWLRIFSEYYLSIESSELVRQFEIAIDTCLHNVGNSYLLIAGRISLGSESGGKTRLFAICNF